MAARSAHTHTVQTGSLHILTGARPSCSDDVGVEPSAHLSVKKKHQQVNKRQRDNEGEGLMSYSETSHQGVA